MRRGHFYLLHPYLVKYLEFEQLLGCRPQEWVHLKHKFYKLDYLAVGVWEHLSNGAFEFGCVAVDFVQVLLSLLVMNEREVSLGV